MSFDKIIITNLSALKEKYGNKVSRVITAIDRLIAADKKRGIETKVVAIDSISDMKSIKCPVVTEMDNQRQVKKAVDAVYKAYQPDYIMILGAPDIIPHQDLKNPAYDPDGDDDKVIASDIPYACEKSYSKDPAKFLGPTRVVGRLPDLMGVNDSAYLISLLGTAAKHKSRVRTDYQKYFSVTADVWKESTSLSLTKLFGSSADMAASPPKGPVWTSSQLSKRIHFINCHGSLSDPNFYGQKGSKYPVAHSAEKLVKKIIDGTVVAAECCYGAELYDPADSDMQSGICNTYLRDGAYGYFGSSTIAYGPSEGNGQADLICQYFLEEVLNGSSLGEATLRARHRFAGAYTHLDPMDLKTAVQFNLLGDPSIHAIQAVSHGFSKTKTYKKVFVKHQNNKGTRLLRREKLAQAGTNLSATLGSVKKINKKISPQADQVLRMAAKESGIQNFSTMSYSLCFPVKASKSNMKKYDSARKGRNIHMIIGNRDLPKGTPGRIVAIVGTWQDGNLIHIRRIHSR
jgi:hypothetical protein